MKDRLLLSFLYEKIKMIKVRVPATSANLGPGFDSLGIAFKYI